LRKDCCLDPCSNRLNDTNLWPPSMQVLLSSDVSVGSIQDSSLSSLNAWKCLNYNLRENYIYSGVNFTIISEQLLRTQIPKVQTDTDDLTVFLHFWDLWMQKLLVKCSWNRPQVTILFMRWFQCSLQLCAHLFQKDIVLAFITRADRFFNKIINTYF